MFKLQRDATFSGGEGQARVEDDEYDLLNDETFGDIQEGESMEVFNESDLVDFLSQFVNKPSNQPVPGKLHRLAWSRKIVSIVSLDHVNVLMMHNL